MTEQDLEEPCDWEDDHGKYCSDCCFFHGAFDDMLRNEGYGFCEFQTWDDMITRDTECYFPDKYERCFW